MLAGGGRAASWFEERPARVIVFAAMKLDRERIDSTFSKVQRWVGLPVIVFGLIYPVIDGQWAFWVPLTIIVGLALMVIIQLYSQWLRGEEMFIAIIVWVAVVMATNGITVKVAYYEAIAQILPVLFLALVVERRLRVSRRPEIRSRVIVIAAYAMALAEYSALRVISDPGTNSESTFSIVTAGLAVAAIAVVLPALVEGDAPPHSGDD